MEMKAISQYITSIQHYFYAYVSFHSFGQRLSFSHESTKTCFFYYDELVKNYINEKEYCFYITFYKYYTFL